MPVPFISSGLSSRGTLGFKAGALVLFERLGAVLLEETVFEGLDVSWVVVAMWELGTVGNGVCRKYEVADGKFSSVARQWLSGEPGLVFSVGVWLPSTADFVINKHTAIY